MSSNDVRKYLEANVAKYIGYDNYLKNENKRLEPYRQKKKEAEEKVISAIKTYKIEDFSVNLPGGSVSYVNEEKAGGTITQAYLKNILMQYHTIKYKNIVQAKRESEELYKYILDNRETKQTCKLDRKINKV